MRHNLKIIIASNKNSFLNYNYENASQLTKTEKIMKNYIYITLSVTFLINSSYADQRNFVMTYEKKMLSPGESEFEMYFTSEFPRNISFENEDSTMLKLEYEFEIGMTDDLEIAFYNTFIQEPGGNLKFDEYKLRFKYNVTDNPNEWVPLFYTELKGNLDFTEYTIEQKFIFTKYFGNFNLSFNPIIEFENEKQACPDCSDGYIWHREIEGELALGVSYQFTKRISAGFDLMTSEYATYFGPVFAHGGEDKYWSFGIMKKMDGLDEKAELIIRSIMGFHF